VPERSVEPTEPESPDAATSATEGATHADSPHARGTEDTAADVTARPRGASTPPPQRHESTTHVFPVKPTASAGPATAQPEPPYNDGARAVPGAGTAIPATTEALDQAELPRMRLFAGFGMLISLGAFGTTFIIAGDPVARAVFRTGAAAIFLTNAWLLWLTTRTGRYRLGPLVVVWAGACFGVMSAVYFFGAFSAAVAAPMLGLCFVALGKSARLAVVVAILVIGSHVAMALPVALGWIRDRALLKSSAVPARQLVVAEVLLVLLLFAAWAMGRWLRRTTSIAVAEVERAKRLIGDQEVQLAEARADAARVKRVGEGRWTGHKVGSFQLGLVLGRGAMGEVYEGKSASGVEAAVKLLTAKANDSPKLFARFHREMAVAAKLDAPSIVKVYEISDPAAEVPYIAMERLYGRDLAAQLRQVGKLVPDDLAALVDQVARGLEVARAAGVVHRDLKPHNIFRAEDADRPPVWKILDFGVSKVLGGAGEGTLTGEGIVGTPQYMAPEQAAGRPVTHAADVYALAAIVYRCITGRPPFTDGDLAQLVYKVVHRPPQRPSTFARVSIPTEEVLAIGLAKDPEARFPSALAFAQALAEARKGRRPDSRRTRDVWS
jgi:serine/threonine-protein kinase